MIGLQGLTLVQRGIQMLNLAFPENPGMTAVLSDVIGRLQTLVPQLVSAQSNWMAGGMMGMAMMPPGAAGGMPQPGGMAPSGMPPAGGVPAPPAGAMPPQGVPQGGPAMPPRPPIG